MNEAEQRAQMPSAAEHIEMVTVPLGTLQAAYHALVSYAHGNAAPALAKACAEEIQQAILKGMRHGV